MSVVSTSLVWDLLILAGASLAFTIVFVLPGFAVTWILRLHNRDDGDVVATAIAFSVLYFSLIGGALIAVNYFGRTAMALLILVPATAGVVPFGRWLRENWRWSFVFAGAVVLAWPWAFSGVFPGVPPAHTLQWLYWDMGRDLSAAGGIPEWTLEYSQQVRWLPDYLFFNIASEVYSGLLFWLDDGQVIGPWRFPVAILGFYVVYRVLCLWVRRPSAALGTVLFALTAFVDTKFNAYKPESVGFVLGLIAVWLAVEGLRQRTTWRVLLAGAVIGVTVSVHTIAATAMAFLMMAAALAELIFVERRLKLPALRMLAAGAVVAFGIVLASGWSLQGRVLVAGDALKPTIVAGADPTLKFINLSAGNSSSRAKKISLKRQFKSNLRHIEAPWKGINIFHTPGRWIVLAILGGLLLLLFFRRRESNRGLVTGLLFGVFLAAVMSFFAFCFETYVPRHTGLSRFAQYAPFYIGVLAALAVDGFLAPLARFVIKGPRLRWVVSLALITVAVGFALQHKIDAWSRARRIRPSAIQAFEYLREHGKPGDVVLQSDYTGGTIEFFTGLEAPLEGRQPLIENVSFLTAANKTLGSAYAFFKHPLKPASRRRHERFLTRIGARWILVAEHNRILGAMQSFGGRRKNKIARIKKFPGLKMVWSRKGIAIFEAQKFARKAPRSPGAKSLWWRFAIAIVMLAGVVVIARKIAGRGWWLPWRSLRRLWGRGGATGQADSG